MKTAEQIFTENLSGLTDFLGPDEFAFYQDVIIKCMQEYRLHADDGMELVKKGLSDNLRVIRDIHDDLYSL